MLRHMPVERVILRGSERRPLPDSRPIGIPDPNSLLSVTVMLRRRNSDLPAPGTEVLSREEFERRFGADPADVAAIEAFANDNDLTVMEVDLGRRSVVLSGRVADLGEAFGTALLVFQSPFGPFRGRVGTLTIPADLSDIIVGVFGL